MKNQNEKLTELENKIKITETVNSIQKLILDANLSSYEMIVLVQNITIPFLSGFSNGSKLPLEIILENYSVDLKEGILAFRVRKAAN